MTVKIHLLFSENQYFILEATTGETNTTSSIPEDYYSKFKYQPSRTKSKHTYTQYAKISLSVWLLSTNQNRLGADFNVEV